MSVTYSVQTFFFLNLIIFCKMKRPNWNSPIDSQRWSFESDSCEVKPGPHAAVRHVSILLLFAALTLC